MKKLFGEFKDFIARGNVMDMAIGVIIGGGIVIAAKDTAVMTSVGTAVGTVITNVANALPGLMGG